MKHKKKIDEIYREGLKDADTPPPADSWEVISSRLPNPKKEKVLPLWLKWGSVAAVFALLITIFNFAFFDNPQPHPVVEQDEKQEIHPVPATNPSGIFEADTRVSNSGAGEDDEINASETIAIEGSPSDRTGAGKNTSEAYAASQPKGSTIASEEKNPEATSIAENTSEKIIPETIISETPTETLLGVKEEKVPATPEVSKDQLLKDMLSQESELAAEIEKQASKNENFLQRLSIATTAGAVYLDMGNNNTADEKFAQNAGGSEVSMAYGINIGYKLSEKIRIRSGVNKVNFSYSTRQVDYAAAMSSRAVNAEPAAAMAMGIVISAAGDLNQEFGFIEVPMEVEFTLIDKKVGLNLIGGASTYFLEENKLALATSTFTTDLGEAQNLNDLSFSANLGLGVNYEFIPKLRLNLEPLLKYQVNTFNHSNSYYFGIYSGLSYSF